MAQLEQRCYQNVIFFREPKANADGEADAAFLVHSRKAKPI